MPISSFPNGFTNGVTIRGLPIQNAYPGQVWWVNNSTILAPGGVAGSDQGPGTYQRPFQTLEGALSNGKLTSFAGRGDIVMVMPNHAETISNATLMQLACAGVLIFGLGSGSSRPTFTLGTATSSTINIQAANMGFINCLFVANFAAVAACFTLTTAKNFYLGNCEFRDSSSALNFVNIVKTDTTSNDADGLYIENCNFYGLGATSNTCLVNALGSNDKWTLKNNYVAHAATTAGGFMQTASGKNITNLLCDNNKGNFVGATTASMAVLILAGGTSNTGVISNNYVQSLCDTTPVMATASSGWKYLNNYKTANADKSGYLLPAVDS